ncbi:MAG: hypothetical protein ACI92W_001112 [Paraglaciecola sp.]|jgi:hypothetical protein
MLRQLLSFNRLMLLAGSLVLFTACGSDEEATPDAGENLLGNWTVQSASVNSVLINGEDISVFFDDLRQLLEGIGIPQGEIDATIQEFEDNLEEQFESAFDNTTFVFNSDGTYELMNPQGSSGGNWELTNNDAAILFDAGTADEITLDIVSFTSTMLVGTITQTEIEDFEGDGTSDTLEITLDITFVK